MIYEKEYIMYGIGDGGGCISVDNSNLCGTNYGDGYNYGNGKGNGNGYGNTVGHGKLVDTILPISDREKLRILLRGNK